MDEKEFSENRAAFEAQIELPPLPAPDQYIWYSRNLVESIRDRAVQAAIAHARQQRNDSFEEGVNIERLRRALAMQGIAAPESLEELAANLARHVNALTLHISDRQQRGELIGEAGTMPGTLGFTMACFPADKVPVGTKLYTAPQPAEPHPPSRHCMCDDCAPSFEDDQPAEPAEEKHGCHGGECATLPAEPVKGPSDDIIRSFDEFTEKYMPKSREEEKRLKERFAQWVKFDDGVARYQGARPAASAEPVELQGIAETLVEGDGIWRSCTGCHELNEGRDTGPYSQTLKCHLGGGCGECGGIGAVWDTTDYQAMADAMARDMAAPVAAQPTVKESLPVAAHPSVPDTIYLGCARMGLAGASDEEVLNYVRIATQRAAAPTPPADDQAPKGPL